MAAIYEHRYEPVSVYGHVVSLLREAVARGGVHLDIGCGYGAIAEPLRDELGLTYIGFDMAEHGLQSLRKRGFEAHLIDLYKLDEAEVIVQKAVVDRPIFSITLLDTLEHLTNGEELLRFLRRLAEPINAPLVLSVPNVAHKDVALKLLTGRWDVTEAGLLDHTHVTLYSHSRLSRLTKTVGWRETAERDWFLYRSDQNFPSSSTILNDGLPGGQFLWDLARQTNPYATVNQFVRLYRVDQPQPQLLLADRAESEVPGRCRKAASKTPPFLSVITRTRGMRSHTLRETLMSLAGQTCQDFEVFVVVHSADEAVVKAVGALVAEFPLSLRTRIEVIACNRPGRSAPLNDAIGYARGAYIAILDDDDRVFAHWVETFQTIASGSPGALIRTRCTKQDFEVTAVEDTGTYPRAVSWFLLSWPDTYDPVAHLVYNDTPNMSIAFPVGVFQIDRLCFDETLEAGEDWDLTTRAAMLRGVASTPEITAIYRRWTSGESTLFRLSQERWESNALRIRAKLDARAILLPPGSASRLQELWLGVVNRDNRIQELGRELVNRDSRVQELGREVVNRDNRIQELERQFRQVIGSVSWRATAPMRAVLKHMSPGQARLLRRTIKLCYWALTPHRIPARLKFLRSRRGP
jgi:2-polyprenyl-3-methyl-5-hydroxy-6-metoxy-1,4-benzoquinol methylase